MSVNFSQTLISVSGLICSYDHLSFMGLRRLTTTKRKAPLRRRVSCNQKSRYGTVTAADSTRRSANYPPTAWNYDFLESLPTHNFTMEKYGEHRELLIKEIKEMLIDDSIDVLTRIEVVDAIDKLGLKRHFEDEIKMSVRIIYEDTNKYADDIYATALRFRILRQHAYVISEDIFNKFKDKNGDICQVFANDIRVLLSLYEASFIKWKGDETLDDVRSFSAQHLKEKQTNLPPRLGKEVQNALDLPLHWRFPRLKARWSIEAYDEFVQPSLIRLAKLDYNIVQNGYKEELKRLVRWWKDLELPRKMPYSRDRLVEHYLWIVGIVEEPQYHHCRELLTKIATLISAVDDTYDVYGTLEELEILTNLIDRWEINGINQLPQPMRHCYLAIYNTSNEISEWTIKEKGFDILPYLSKSWARLCKLYLQEAKWYDEGYKPSLREYIDHGIVSISAHQLLLSSYYLTTPSISEEAIDYINNLPNLVRCGGTILRLINDLGTSSDELARGDTIKALQCYMHESGACENVAREHINNLMEEAWKKMNEEYYLLRPQYPRTISEPFLSASLNLARTSQFFYSYKKDWHGKPDKEMMDHTTSLLVNPIPMPTLNVTE